MTAQSRYYIDEQGQEWFAFGPVDEHYRGDVFVNHGRVATHKGLEWLPVDQVKITDALACSRTELGPVYVVFIDDDESRLEPELLWGVNNRGEVVAENDVEVPGLPYSTSSFEIATLQELKDAGVE